MRSTRRPALHCATRCAVRVGGRRCTLDARAASRRVAQPRVLVIDGDWSGSTHALAEAARRALRPGRVVARASGDVGLAAYELARDLAQP